MASLALAGEAFAGSGTAAGRCSRDGEEVRGSQGVGAHVLDNVGRCWIMSDNAG